MIKRDGTDFNCNVGYYGEEIKQQKLPYLAL